MAARVFVDGHAGTTGLRIHELLADRADLDVLVPEEGGRKDPDVRRELLRKADVAILCLPDDAAREAVAWAGDTRIIDASTAHRVAEGWTYGLPELAPGQRAAIARAQHVSNPGCWPQAFVLALRPLVDAGLLRANAPLTAHGLSGYSGGGRTLIERWEDPELGLLHHVHEAPYALDRVHKHVPEMTRYAELEHEPHFVPAVGPFRCGMRVELPLPAGVLAPGATGKTCWETLHARYEGEPFVRVAPLREPLDADEASFDPRALNDTNELEIACVPNPLGHVLLVVRLDNLGKGAAGAAIQSINLMLGLPEDAGLPANGGSVSGD